MKQEQIIDLLSLLPEQIKDLINKLNYHSKLLKIEKIHLLKWRIMKIIMSCVLFVNLIISLKMEKINLKYKHINARLAIKDLMT